MGRTPDVLDDPTPLDGPRVDVRVRVAWLLRMSRSAGRRRRRRSRSPRWRGLLRDQGCRPPPPSVSGWETGRVAPSTRGRRGLRARAGPRARHPARRRRHGPAHLRPRPARGHRPRPRRWCDARPGRRARARATGRATGADWLHFCDAALGGAAGPARARLMRPAVDRLVSERRRSVFTAYLTRYEALSLLRAAASTPALVLAGGPRLRRRARQPGRGRGLRRGRRARRPALPAAPRPPTSASEDPG